MLYEPHQLILCGARCLSCSQGRVVQCSTRLCLRLRIGRRSWHLPLQDVPFALLSGFAGALLEVLT